MDNTARNLLVALLLLLIVALALSSTMGGMMGPGMMMGRGGGWMWGVGMWVGGLVMLVFWGALILVAVLVVRHLAGGFAEHDSRMSPLDILKRRYASGEITRDQYEQMRKDLEP